MGPIVIGLVCTLALAEGGHSGQAAGLAGGVPAGGGTAPTALTDPKASAPSARGRVWQLHAALGLAGAASSSGPVDGPVLKPADHRGATKARPGEDLLLVQANSPSQLNNTPPSPGGTVPPTEITAPVLSVFPFRPAELQTPPAAPGRVTGENFFLMRELQGTWIGAVMEANHLYAYGWATSSYTASSAAVSNLPMAWNDRANEFLFQQGWFRFGRSVLYSKSDPVVGFQADVLVGSDYRFTLPRGLFNSQLQNADGNQNLYGVDLIQHYVNLYVPTLFNGVDFRVGRLYTPWGVESLEAVSTPLISRSYAFNSAPPFTHCGVGAYVTFDPVWQGIFMAANGNDVYFGYPAEEWRFVGALKWIQPGGGRNTVTVATSVGRGKFNEGAPYSAATIALANEPFGRNNINVFDVIWTHTFNPRLSYNLEGIYGYQTNVPPGANLNGYGTAHWASLAHYLFVTLTPRLNLITRFETFDDFQGQRTGFEGLYLTGTAGLTFKPSSSVILRAEMRYDNNVESRPFEGKRDLITAAVDLTLRF